ncbi:MAG TPA: hypothetical protein VM901_03550 [Bdellovibrionota bacterium]|jgi:hypothetical protein|nr:hypothetical protein [Bdellovibrionota bacterium]
MKAFRCKFSKNILGKFKYVSAVALAMAVSSCGLNPDEPVLDNKTVRVKKGEAPKVALTCRLKQDSDERFYVYKTDKKQYFITKASDTSKPLQFKTLGKDFSTFGLSNSDFGDGVGVASVKHQTGDQTGWIAIVTNADAKTLEVVRFESKSAEVAKGAVAESSLIKDTEVLFSSENCEVGKTKDAAKAEAKTNAEKAKTGAAKAADKTADATKDAAEALKQEAKGNDAAAEVNKDQAKDALEKAKEGVKQAGDAAHEKLKEGGQDIKEEINQLVDNPKPSRTALDALRELVAKK